VLLTTQYLDEADQLASRIVIVDHGRTIATGTPAELKRRIGGQVIEIHAHERGQLEAIAAALHHLEHGRPQIDEATRRVTIGTDSAGQGLRAALRMLEAAELEVDDIALRQPTLNEVFLALTGQPSTDDTTAHRAAAA
jgi:ABC-2 type transport system ATP-binding protein